MHIATHISEIRAQVKTWKKADEKIVFVPTMGNLHAGHLAGVELAHQHGSKVIVSIFVNPMQFGAAEDFGNYPRTLESDIEKLVAVKTHLLFAPVAHEIYPAGHQLMTRVEVPGYSEILCGLFRPGHFIGVATVVSKLFNIVTPDTVILGNKDYQQQLVIKRLVQDLSMSIKIIGLPTVRETDGLAMSSRNQYLQENERVKAAFLYQLLNQVAVSIKKGARNYAQMELEAMQTLKVQGFLPDYFAVRNAENLAEPDPACSHLVILVAAKLGGARLIDNVEISV